MKRIILFGTGSISKLLVENLRDDVRIIGYLANEEERENIEGVPVIDQNCLENLEYDYIVVAFGNSLKGVEYLKGMGVPENKIVAYTYCNVSYKDNEFQNKLEEMMVTSLHSDMIPQLFHLPHKKHFICSMNSPENYDVISQDYVREQTLAFLAEEIRRRKIKGNVAEIGVAHGEFAAKISKVFPDRYLYLFDTFEGLPEKDKKTAIDLGWGERAYAYKERGTSEKEVLRNMPYPNMIIIKKGYFPDSFDLEDDFAFVSIDIDFYDSTRRGMEAVYPHVSNGGYIMVHDFHNLAFPESREAVLDFCNMNDVKYVPIPDCGGSVVIVK